MLTNEQYYEKLRNAGFTSERDIGEHWKELTKTIEINDKMKVEFAVEVGKHDVELKIFVIFDKTKYFSCKVYDRGIKGYPEPEEILHELFNVAYDMFGPIAIRMSEGIIMNQ